MLGRSTLELWLRISVTIIRRKLKCDASMVLLIVDLGPIEWINSPSVLHRPLPTHTHTYTNSSAILKFKFKIEYSYMRACVCESSYLHVCMCIRIPPHAIWRTNAGGCPIAKYTYIECFECRRRRRECERNYFIPFHIK